MVKVLVFHKYHLLPRPFPPLPHRPQSLPDYRLLLVGGSRQVRRVHTIHRQSLHLPLQIGNHRKSPLLRQSHPPPLVPLVFYPVAAPSLFVLQVERFRLVIQMKHHPVFQHLIFHHQNRHPIQQSSSSALLEMVSPVYSALGFGFVPLEILAAFFVVSGLNVSTNLSKAIRWANRDFLDARTCLGSLIEPDVLANSEYLTYLTFLTLVQSHPTVLLSETLFCKGAICHGVKVLLFSVTFLLQERRMHPYLLDQPNLFVRCPLPSVLFSCTINPEVKVGANRPTTPTSVNLFGRP